MLINMRSPDCVDGPVGSVVLQRFSVHFELNLIARLDDLVVHRVVEPVLHHPAHLAYLSRTQFTRQGEIQCSRLMAEHQ